jgi:hypothetical protein
MKKRRGPANAIASPDQSPVNKRPEQLKFQFNHTVESIATAVNTLSKTQLSRSLFKVSAVSKETSLDIVVGKGEATLNSQPGSLSDSEVMQIIRGMGNYPLPKADEESGRKLVAASATRHLKLESIMRKAFALS